MSTRAVAGRAVARVALVALALSAPSLGIACGVCDEDNVAATYDHAVVEQAARARDLVVYCRLDGVVARQTLLSVVRRVPGVRKKSVRVSSTPSALSFAVNPAMQTALTAVAATEKGLGPSSHVRILKVVSPASTRRAS